MPSFTQQKGMFFKYVAVPGFAYFTAPIPPASIYFPNTSDTTRSLQHITAQWSGILSPFSTLPSLQFQPAPVQHSILIFPNIIPTGIPSHVSFLYASLIEFYNQASTLPPTKPILKALNGKEFNVEAFLRCIKTISESSNPFEHVSSLSIVVGILRMTKNYLLWISTTNVTLTPKKLAIESSLLTLTGIVKNIVYTTISNAKVGNKEDKTALKNLERLYTLHIDLSTCKHSHHPPLEEGIKLFSSTLVDIKEKLNAFRVRESLSSGIDEYEPALEDFKKGKPITVSLENLPFLAESIAKLRNEPDVDFLPALQTLFNNETSSLFQPSLIYPHVVSALIQIDLAAFLPPLVKELLPDLKTANDLEVNPLNIPDFEHHLEELTARHTTLVNFTQNFLNLFIGSLPTSPQTLKDLLILLNQQQPDSEVTLIKELGSWFKYARGETIEISKAFGIIGDIIQHIANNTPYTSSLEEAYMRFANSLILGPSYFNFIEAVRQGLYPH
jgi:hypothetical protein